MHRHFLELSSWISRKRWSL